MSPYDNKNKSDDNKFYSIDPTELDENKKIILNLLQDSHLEYWNCPINLRKSSFVLSDAYRLTSFYTNNIVDQILKPQSQVTIYKHCDNYLCFSISHPSNYFNDVYEIIEQHLKFQQTTYKPRIFQPALFISRNDQFKIEKITTK